MVWSAKSNLIGKSSENGVNSLLMFHFQRSLIGSWSLYWYCKESALLFYLDEWGRHLEGWIGNHLCGYSCPKMLLMQFVESFSGAIENLFIVDNEGDQSTEEALIWLVNLKYTFCHSVNAGYVFYCCWIVISAIKLSEEDVMSAVLFVAGVCQNCTT